MSVLTLLDIVKLNSSDIAVGLVDEAARMVPEITGIDPWTGNRVPNMGAGKTIDGIMYEILVRTGLPEVAFRSANEGTDPTKSREELRRVECFSMTPRWSVDRVIADRSKEPLNYLMTLQANAHFQAALQHLGAQFYYGTSNDAKGFTGLLAQYNSADMTVDAGGTTANTGSSVWGVKFGPQFCEWVYGNNGRFDISDIRTQDAFDSNSKPYSAFVQEMVAHVGLQLGNKYSVGRIKKITADSGKTLDDDMLADLISKAPVGYRFDCFFMSRRSMKQLRASRTATNTTGAPAPFPTEAHGVPIIVTDSIEDTESLTL